jgi:hypothetical protein
VDNKSTFDKHIGKILAALNISAEELLFFETKPKALEQDYVVSTDSDTKSDYHMSVRAQKQYDLLMDIVGLCEIYY